LSLKAHIYQSFEVTIYIAPRYFGADIDAKSNDDWTALMVAAMGGYIENVQILLDYKADINARNNEDQTALSFSKQNKHTDIVTLLEKYGAE
jgi:ankyrin repeat protein